MADKASIVVTILALYAQKRIWLVSFGRNPRRRAVGGQSHAAAVVKRLFQQHSKNG